MSVTAVVVAAGSGERLGAGRPKALVTLAGEPMVVHAVRAVGAASSVDRIVVVVGADHVDAAREATADLTAQPVAVVAGGATRTASVLAGVTTTSTEVVAIHDAARPLVSPALIDAAVEELVAGPDSGRSWSAVAPAVPVVDTLKLVEPTTHQVVRTVDRGGLWAVQTPQVFARATWLRVHERLGPTEVTDDLALVEAAGGRIGLVPGERRNFKITYPDDLVMAEALLAEEGR